MGKTEDLKREFAERSERLLERARTDVALRDWLALQVESIRQSLDSQATRGGTQPLHRLTLGSLSAARGKIELPGLDREELTDLGARCAAMAAASRRVLARVNGEPATAESADNMDLKAWEENLENSYYWLDQSVSTTHAKSGPGLIEDVAGCYDTLAAALGLASTPTLAPARYLPLVAEAQSALREALQRLGKKDEPVQVEAFVWVKETAARHHVFLGRFMRIDDHADPSRWRDLASRVDALGGSANEERHSERLEAIRRGVEAIRAGEPPESEWVRIADAVSLMIADGLPPSHKGVRDLLLPVIEGLPDNPAIHEALRPVLNEIDRYLASQVEADTHEQVSELTPELEATRTLLAGKTLALIGGSRRREAERALIEAFSLTGLTWIATREHQSISGFEPIVARPEVALVLLAIRWSSHAFGDVRKYCERHGKPLVRLPGGYSPNQVAAQIVAQCSDKIREH